MLWTVAIIFALLWVLGLATGNLLDGYVHSLLITSVALLIAGAYKAGRGAHCEAQAVPKSPENEKKTTDEMPDHQ